MLQAPTRPARFFLAVKTSSLICVCINEEQRRPKRPAVHRGGALNLHPYGHPEGHRSSRLQRTRGPVNMRPLSTSMPSPLRSGRDLANALLRAAWTAVLRTRGILLLDLLFEVDD